jgi:hypothetical protein
MDNPVRDSSEESVDLRHVGVQLEELKQQLPSLIVAVVRGEYKQR